MATAWVPLDSIAWVDRVTGEQRRDSNKKIELVTAREGEILVQDEGGTHRMIPIENILDFRWAVFG